MRERERERERERDRERRGKERMTPALNNGCGNDEIKVNRTWANPRREEVGSEGGVRSWVAPVVQSLFCNW